MITSTSDTTRQNILNYLKTLMEAVVDDASVTVFKKVELTRVGPPDLDTAPIPSCFIYSNGETRLESEERAAIGKENWEWYVNLEVWAREQDLESILKFVHKKVYDNYTLGNYANWAERMGVDFFTIDPENRIESMAIPVRIVYRHTNGAM